jgi:hypothetical protein
VLQVGRRLDLGEEPLSADDRRELGLEHLERDASLVLQIVSEIDRRHTPFAELTLDAIATFQGCVQPSDRIGHPANMRHGPANGQRPIPVWALCTDSATES